MKSALKKIHKISPRNTKIIIALLLVVLFAVPPLARFSIAKADAGTLTSYKVQINNSQAAATGVTYQFFWTTSATTSIKQIDIQVCTTASGTCTAPAGFSSGTPTLANDNIAGSGRTVSAPTGNAFRVVVTTPAAQSTQTMDLDFTGVTNPSTTNTTYYVRTTTYSDTGTTVIDGTTGAAFAVLNTNSIAVTATVDPNFTFTVARAVTGTVNGDTINVSSTADNSIPFGSLNTTTASVAAHDVTITTNATNGYTVTASAAATTQAGSPPLVSGSVNHFSNFTGTNAAPTVWSAPNGSTANTNTGFFGYTTENTTLCTGTASRFSGTKYAGFTNTGLEVICSTTGVSSQTTRLGWKLAINSIQPAGAYTGTIILVATPTY